MKIGLVLATTLLAATSALAQTSAPAPREPGPPVLTTPAVPPTGIVQGGSPDIANSGPASTGTLARSGTGADNLSNNTAATSNSSDPARAIPNVGGGGGDSGQ
ncbi:hypothetical protein [uncultured Methylobacterium sp.]|jgi:hypothetical protein|uniref:hypothetical protein n=1 Tax=uncultured Methylobacterium sp. TaxID=157278 RepID=UPI00260963B9|nr:hypothetical protein [uncultured Methylobacterium sp.]